jgi:outer membrane protein assembly factor BamB
MWFGADWILRNKQSGPRDSAWTDDLTSGVDRNYRMPKSVRFCFAGSMQPIVVGQIVGGADVQGQVYAIRWKDGSTCWTSKNDGGALWPGVASTDVVAFSSLRGFLRGYAVTHGRLLWQIDTEKAITSVPALAGGVVVGNIGWETHLH